MLFPSGNEDGRSDVNGVSHEEPKIDERDSKGQDQDDENDGTGSRDLMRMMLFKNQFALNYPSSRISPNRFESDTISSSLLGDTLSISSSSIAPHNPRGNILQNLPASDSRHQSSHHFHEISDSCSSSTTSIWTGYYLPITSITTFDSPQIIFPCLPFFLISKSWLQFSYFLTCIPTCSSILHSESIFFFFSLCRGFVQ